MCVLGGGEVEGGGGGCFGRFSGWVLFCVRRGVSFLQVA